MPEELNEQEIYYIRYYNSMIPNGYNMIQGGTNGSGLAKSKEVEQYDLEGNYLASFYSAAEAERQTGVSIGNICSCCRGKRNTAGNFQWKYKDNKYKTEIKDLIKIRKEKQKKEDEKVRKRKRIVLQLDKNDNIINKFKTCTEASRMTGIHLGNINSCVNGTRSSAGGYQ